MTAVFAATSGAIAYGVFLTRQFFETKLADVEQRAVEEDLQSLRSVIEAQMIASDRRAFEALVSEIARAEGVTWVGVLDRNGTVQVSSGRARESARLPQQSEERAILRRWEASKQTNVRTHINRGSDTLRTMMPIANTEKCWRCHGDGHAINGMLIIDRSLKPLRQTMASATIRLAFGGVAGLIIILGTLGFVFEWGVLRRLEQFRVAARHLGRGDLTARVQDSGGDELGDVAREFNAMASRLQATMLQLAAKRGQLDALINGIADGIVLLDLEGRIMIMNRAFANRMHREAPRGSTYRDALRAVGIHDAHELPAERALSNARLEKGVVTVAGGRRVEEIYAQPLIAADGRATAVIEVWRDITDRKNLEASVEQSERLAALGILASSVAHEVGNPLASIVTAVDALLGRLPSTPSDPHDEECRSYLEVVRKQVFRCHRVTERLLGFARVPSGGPDCLIDVVAVAREVATLIGPQARAQGVELELHAPGQVLALAPDGVVEQVFLNLTLNALKAMPSSGKLRVDIATEELTVNVAFADTGPGIPEGIAKDLFQPFRSSRSNGRGAGLGLFISHALLARSGGKIEVHSTAGQGATFIVSLRRANREAADSTLGRAEAVA